MSETMETRAPSPRVPRIWLLAAALALILTAVVAAGLWQLRREAIAGQSRELAVLSLALADELDRGMQGLELVLQATRLDLREGRLPLEGEAASQALHERVAQVRLMRKLWIVDADGSQLAGSAPPPAIDAQSFLPALDVLDAESSAVSLPFEDMTAHEAALALAMRFAGAPGQRGGWVVAEIQAEALRGAFTTASPAADARMAVYRSDGARLAGSLAAQPSPASTVASNDGPDRADPRSAGEDSSLRLVAQRTLPRLGLRIVLTRDVQAVLKPWREVSRFAVSGLVLLLLAMAGLVHLIQRAERRRSESQQALEAQRSRTTRLESLGTLAGGVAHDFNNVLAAVLGYAEMARQTAAEGSAQARQIDHVLQAALRGKSLVGRILAFSRSGARASTLFEAQPVVEEVLVLLKASLPAGVTVEPRLEAPGAMLKGDSTQLFEAAMNLCTNAAQAMPGGGVLEVSLQREHVDAARLVSHGKLAAGDHLRLTVADAGVGIAPEVMERLFEPFFTTRGAHAGTGLGLAVVHGVVNEWGGAIDVRSSVGRGARFTLYLPMHLPQASGEAVAVAPPDASAVQGHGQTLLVVDDDPALVELAEEMLAGLGYEPVGFSDPQAALAALRSDPSRFDAVLTDEVMPGMSGTELTQTLRAFAPALPVLLLSGYGGPQLAARAAKAGVTQVLAKPLQREALARTLEALIHPHCGFAAPPQGDDAGGPAEPDSRRLLG